MSIRNHIRDLRSDWVFLFFNAVFKGKERTAEFEHNETSLRLLSRLGVTGPDLIVRGKEGDLSVLEDPLLPLLLMREPHHLPEIAAACAYRIYWMVDYAADPLLPEEDLDVVELLLWYAEQSLENSPPAYRDSLTKAWGLLQPLTELLPL